MRALSSSFDKEGASVKQNKAQKEILTKEIGLQKDKIAQLNSMLEQSAAKYGENDNKTLKWKQAVADATTQLNKMEGELKSLPSSLDIIGTKFTTVGEKIKGVSQKISGIGQTLTTSISLPIVGAGTAAVKFASDYEENLNKVDVAFKDNAKEVKEWAKTATTQFGLSENAALEATSLFGDMGTSMGLTTEDASAMATSLTGLAGDLSSFKNVGIDQAMTALNGVFTGETESLKTLGVVMTETNLKQFAEDCGLVYDEMSQSEKVTLRYNYVLSQTKNAQGDYARTSDGTANSMRTFQATLNNLAVTFGQELLPVVTPVIQGLTDMVNKFGSLDDKTKQTIITVAGIAAAAGPVLMVLGGIGSAIGGIATGVGVVLPIMGTLATTIVGIGASALAALPGIVAFIAPFAPFIAIAAGVVAAGVLIYKNWDTIKEKAQELGNAIKEKWDSIKTGTAEAWGNVKSKVSETWTSIKEKTSTAISDIKEKITNGWNNAKTKTKDAWTDMKNKTSTGAADMASKVKDKLSDIKTKFGDMKTDVLDKASGMWTNLKTKFSTGGTDLVKTVKEKLNDVATKFKELKDSALQWGKDMVDSFIDGFKKGWESFKSWLKGEKDSVNSEMNETQSSATKSNTTTATLNTSARSVLNSARILAASANTVATDIGVGVNGNAVAAAESSNVSSAILGALNIEDIYEAIKQGASDATLTIDIDGRELKRNLSGMGVQFA